MKKSYKSSRGRVHGSARAWMNKEGQKHQIIQGVKAQRQQTSSIWDKFKETVAMAGILKGGK